MVRAYSERWRAASNRIGFHGVAFDDFSANAADHAEVPQSLRNRCPHGAAVAETCTSQGIHDFIARVLGFIRGSALPSVGDDPQTRAVPFLGPTDGKADPRMKLRATRGEGRLLSAAVSLS